MFEYLIISVTALAASTLTFFSGFGLGTILLPVFALFVPLELAITMTAIVHFLNNLFKLSIAGRNINWAVVLRFGIPSVVAAFAGAYLLLHVGGMEALATYELFGHAFAITPVNLVIAVLLAIFALIEILPFMNRLEVPPRFLVVGGLLSGFFGGLSGHQGALRSMFLIRSNLTKRSFIATGIVIACFVDITRLLVYAKSSWQMTSSVDYTLLTIATLSAFVGAYLGNRLLNKITIVALQNIVSAMLLIFAIALGMGLISK